MKITLTQFKISFVGLIWLLADGQSQASGQHTGAHEHNDAAVGKPGLASSVNRTVAVDTNDNMRFEPDKLQVRQGETIRFRKFTPVMSKATSAAARMHLGSVYLKAPGIANHGNAMTDCPVCPGAKELLKQGDL